jgi:hypothetical protein
MARKNVMANGSAFYAQNNSTEFQICGATGQLYHNGVAITAQTQEINNVTLNQTVQTISSGAPGANINGYGLTIIDGDTGGSYYINAPSYAGVKKTVLFRKGSTLPYIIKSSNNSTTAGWYFNMPSASNSSQITFNTTALSSGGANPFVVDLYGKSTHAWIYAPTYGSSLSTNFYTVGTT